MVDHYVNNANQYISNIAYKYIVDDMFITDQGHVFYLIEFERPSRAIARLLTPYKNTSGVCMEMSFMRIPYSLLIVYVRGEDYVERNVTTRMTNYTREDGEPVSLQC